ncbi:hypothetical protein AB0J03_01445 [Streptomyces microflavus]
MDGSACGVGRPRTRPDVVLADEATRYEKTATVCLAGLHVAAILIWSAR